MVPCPVPRALDTCGSAQAGMRQGARATSLWPSFIVSQPQAWREKLSGKSVQQASVSVRPRYPDSQVTMGTLSVRPPGLWRTRQPPLLLSAVQWSPGKKSLLLSGLRKSHSFAEAKLLLHHRWSLMDHGARESCRMHPIESEARSEAWLGVCHLCVPDQVYHLLSC